MNGEMIKRENRMFEDYYITRLKNKKDMSFCNYAPGWRYLDEETLGVVSNEEIVPNEELTGDDIVKMLEKYLEENRHSKLAEMPKMVYEAMRKQFKTQILSSLQ